MRINIQTYYSNHTGWIHYVFWFFPFISLSLVFTDVLPDHLVVVVQRFVYLPVLRCYCTVLLSSVEYAHRLVRTWLELGSITDVNFVVAFFCYSFYIIIVFF